MRDKKSRTVLLSAKARFTSLDKCVTWIVPLNVPRYRPSCVLACCPCTNLSKATRSQALPASRHRACAWRATEAWLTSRRK
jgi:hypothetical protein